MSIKQIAQYAVPVNSDTGNSADTLVMRDSDNSVNLGLVNATDLVLTKTVALKYSATKTGSYTANNETLIPCNTSGGNFTVTLPPVASVPGRVYVFVNESASNTLTIQANASELINSANTTTLTGTAFLCKRLMSNGTIWYII